MTAKEKAREMVDKIQEGLWRDRAVRIYQEDAVYTALIAVDEIITFGNQLGIREPMMYWKQVKQEIENL